MASLRKLNWAWVRNLLSLSFQSYNNSLVMTKGLNISLCFLQVAFFLILIQPNHEFIAYVLFLAHALIKWTSFLQFCSTLRFSLIWFAIVWTMEISYLKGFCHSSSLITVTACKHRAYPKTLGHEDSFANEINEHIKEVSHYVQTASIPSWQHENTARKFHQN